MLDEISFLEGFDFLEAVLILKLPPRGIIKRSVPIHAAEGGTKARLAPVIEAHHTIEDMVATQCLTGVQ